MKQLRGFLGLAGYCHKFIQSYGALSKPLTNLLKKGASEWSLAATTTFNQLKKALVTAPVLALPDFTQPFKLEMDALGEGIGIILI